MHLLIYGPGRLGGAIALAASDAGWMARLVGRPDATGRGGAAAGGDGGVEASAGQAGGGNVGRGRAGGKRRLGGGWRAGVRLAARG